MILPLLALSFFPSISALANTQCLCHDYEPCIQVNQIDFNECFVTCQKTIRRTHQPYVKCLKRLIPSLDKVYECTKTFVHDGCTVNKYNVAQVRNFNVFVKAGKDRMAALAPKVQLNLTFVDDETPQFNECVAKCFFLPENECTTSLNCALNMPDEQRMLSNMRECALSFDKELFMSIVDCMALVTEPFKKIEKPKDNFKRRRL